MSYQTVSTLNQFGNDSLSKNVSQSGNSIQSVTIPGSADNNFQTSRGVVNNSGIFPTIYIPASYVNGKFVPSKTVVGFRGGIFNTFNIPK